MMKLQNSSCSATIQHNRAHRSPSPDVVRVWSHMVVLDARTTARNNNNNST